MRILLVHNRYRQRGGEEAVLDAESALLRERGHEVLEFLKDNRDLDAKPGFRVAVNAIWARRSRNEVEQLVRESRPDIVHFHNTQPRISPAAYYAVRAHGVPVVQTLHNFRLMCPSATFFRDGKVCEDCLGKVLPWPGVLHACYRNSRTASGTVAATIALHRGLGTWTKLVDRHIALTHFAKAKFVEGGLSEERIAVKPNFVVDCGYPRSTAASVRKGALFVGRLSPEKGLLTLVRAWRKLTLPLQVIGDGPLLRFVSESVLPAVQTLGAKPKRGAVGGTNRG